jgi:hypothetical protein
LVLDVSRWGRFQDVDESAYYEFLCRQSGVRVQYCAESFVNDLSPYSNLVKAIKRMMAAEYSRELGVKVLQCGCFWTGRLTLRSLSPHRVGHQQRRHPGQSRGVRRRASKHHCMLSARQSQL